MTQITPIHAYSIYQGMKLHFTGTYDFFKYKGQVSITEETFKRKKEYYTFVGLAKRYNEQDYKDLVLSNILRKPNIYCRELLSDESRATMLEYQKRIGALAYTFGQDIMRLLEVCDRDHLKFEDMMVVNEGQHPILLNQYEWRVISLETLIILNGVLGFFGYWNKRIDEQIIWPRIHNLCVKYEPFMQYDKVAYTKLLRDKL